MVQTIYRFLAVLLLLSGAACGDDDATVLRGGAGESCTSRDDCETGLRCLAQVCVGTADETVDGGTGPSGAGCRARPDCAAGLSCVSNVCTPAPMGVSGDGRYSGRGESCAAGNDCADGLACVSGTCRDVTVQLSRTTKQCARVECAVAEDCCASFVPNENCDVYEANCETDPIFCNTFRSLCVCSRDCFDEVCVSAAPGCATNAECTSQQTPFCTDGRCVQCTDDGSCPGAGSRCIEGVCRAPCEVDENCPLLHACQAGECVDVGCRSDRECVFLDSDPRSVCQEDGTCDVPCERDSECTEDGERFQVCDGGRCVFVGCETDVECRALLRIESSADDVRAVCR